MNDAFEKLLNRTVGARPELEEKLKEAEAEVEELKRQIQQKNEAEEQEIIIRYMPNVPLSVRFIKGEKPLVAGEPDNAVALIDAASLVMSKLCGIDQAVLTAALLNTLVRATELEAFLKGACK